MEPTPLASSGTSEPRMPSPKQQSWGAVISIVIIMAMIITGAFYAWGERIAEERAFTTPEEGV